MSVTSEASTSWKGNLADGAGDVALRVDAVMPGLAADDFARIATEAKTGGPVSAAPSGIEITVEATLA